MAVKKVQDRVMDSQIFRTPHGHDLKTLDGRGKLKVDEYLQHYKELRLRNYIKLEEEKDLQLNNFKQNVVQLLYEALAYQ